MVKTFKNEHNKPAPRAANLTNGTIKNVMIVVVVAAVAAFVFVLVQASRNGVKNLINANNDNLKEAMFGNKPYLFYCNTAKGKKKDDMKIPQLFVDLNGQRGSKYGFAMVNCSQLLPSGKSMWDRFKLKRDWNPAIFATMPWARPVQIGPKYMSNVTHFTKYIDRVFTPRSTPVSTTTELSQFCKFDHNTTHESSAVQPTCFVLARGARYAPKHAELESKLLLTYPKVKFASIDASSRKLSVEDSRDPVTADDYALRVHALRNGTHHSTMVNPATWDYINTFVSHALALPLSGFRGDGSEAIVLRKIKKNVFKQRQQYQPPNTQKEASSEEDSEQDDESSDRQAGAQGARARAAPEEAEVEVEVEDLSPAAQTRLRERARRAEMDRQARHRLYDDDDDLPAAAAPSSSSSSSSPEEDIIEL